jgi:Cell division protein FtsI/penicillin-binding protein 2
VQKSSNVGASKIALSLPNYAYYHTLQKAGFGELPTSEFPGEASGHMPSLRRLDDFTYATMSFGYGLSASLLQLARAYMAFANGGIIYPISLLKLEHAPLGTRLFSPKVAEEMRMILHTVEEQGGTGVLANIPGYLVAGKTGTSNQVKKGGGFSHENYNALFAGLAPLEQPKLVIAIRMNRPHRNRADHFGGNSAAPVFAMIAKQALPLMGQLATVPSIDQHFFRFQRRYLDNVVDN